MAVRHGAIPPLINQLGSGGERGRMFAAYALSSLMTDSDTAVAVRLASGAQVPSRAPLCFSSSSLFLPSLFQACLVEREREREREPEISLCDPEKIECAMGAMPAHKFLGVTVDQSLSWQN